MVAPVRLGFISTLKTAFYRSQALIGLNPYLRRPDRKVLETVIFPALVADHSLQRVLFVGCEWYTKHYSRIFASKDFWTLDIDSDVARFGADKHIIDAFENVGRHFGENSLDLIICNGVLGWGLDTHEAATAAFSASLACLRPGGILLLGWDDMPHAKPFHPGENAGIRKFSPYVFPALGVSELVTATRYRHTYNFYVKAPRI